MPYTVKSTGREIESSRIISVTDDGLLELLDNSAVRFIPADDLITPTSLSDSYKEASIGSIPAKSNTTPYDTSTSTDASRYNGIVYNYKLGINAIDIKSMKPKDSSGFITKAITIGNVDHIELSATVVNGNASMEYYIIDGTKETPILPQEETWVKEKLFYGLSTRFNVNPDEDITIYVNGEKSDYTLADKDSFDYKNNEYYIIYTPIEAAHKYSPSNSEIKIKVIERILTNCTPTGVKDITIIKIGSDSIYG